VSAAPVAAPVREALAAATDAFSAAGVATPSLDAELLLAAAIGSDLATLRAHADGVVDPAAGRGFGAMVRRRLAREPVAYILGRKAFRRLELDVDRRVLIPRPETELLVEVAVGLDPASVLDVGTGSGAVALAIADEHPEARVVATDTSPAALEVARANAARLGLGERISFQSGTLLAGERFDLLVANLPYVSESEWDGLAAEIVRYEPREALVAGPTGLEAIESLLDDIARLAAPPRAVALEVGVGQATRVGGLLRSAGFGQVEVRQDLGGIDRVVLGR
jgi:release factor glutamine methyltransferase